MHTHTAKYWICWIDSDVLDDFLQLFGAHSDVEARFPEGPYVYHMTDWITRLLIKQQKQIAYLFKKLLLL